MYIYLVATRTDPCETIIPGPKWQLVSNSSDILFGDVDPYLLSTHLSTAGFKSPLSKGKIGNGTFFQPSGSEGEDVTYCLLNFHHPVGGQPLEKPWKALRCWDQDDLEWRELGRTYLELAWNLISFGGMCWWWLSSFLSLLVLFLLLFHMMIMTSWNLPASKAKSQNQVIVHRWKVKINWDFAWPKNAIVTREDTLKALKVTQV